MTIVKPDVPGTVIRFVGTTIPRIVPTAAETVAVPIVADWGPIGADDPGSDGRQGGKQLVTSFAEYTGLFGDSDTPGRTAVAGAFAGQGLPGLGGAGGVLAYRMAAGAAAAAAHTFVDRQVGPVNALTLRGKYKGTRGNRLSVTIDTDPSDATRDRLRVLLDGSVRETFLYAQADIAGLAASINLRSALVTATALETGQRLAAVVGTALTGGNDGSTLGSQDHLNALAALEFAPFGIISPFDLEDGAILASYVSWVRAQETANRPVRLVVGGAAGEDLTTAITRSAACADPHVINVGVGTYHDDLLDKDLGTAQLAPRVAGMLAAKGQQHSLTYSKIGGLHVNGVTGISSDAVATAIKAGVVVLMQVEAADADLRIAKGVTTFTSTTDADRPLDVFSDARLVGIMDNYIRNMRAWGDDTIIGEKEVNDDTRADVYGHARMLQDELLTAGLILPGDPTAQPPIPAPYVIVDDPQDPQLADAIPYSFGWQFARTANAILGEGTIR